MPLLILAKRQTHEDISHDRKSRTISKNTPVISFREVSYSRYSGLLRKSVTRKRSHCRIELSAFNEDDYKHDLQIQRQPNFCEEKADSKSTVGLHPQQNQQSNVNIGNGKICWIV